MKGITFNQVREVLAKLQNQIPATEEVCTEYTMSCGPACPGNKASDDFYFLSVKCGKIKIELKVFGAMLVSEGE